MRSRPLAIFTAVLLMLFGAVLAWLLLSIPNDLRADAILKAARADIEAGKREDAREKLLSVVQQFPRTDAAATAMAILFRLSDQDRDLIRKQLEALAAAQKTSATVMRSQTPVTDSRRADAPSIPLPSPSPSVTPSPSPTPSANATAKPKPAPTPRRKTSTTRRH